MILGEGFANIRVGMVLSLPANIESGIWSITKAPMMYVAIEREKQIKGWLRAKKIALIESMNPAWRDLSADWFG